MAETKKTPPPAPQPQNSVPSERPKMPENRLVNGESKFPGRIDGIKKYPGRIDGKK
ncbi:MAG: hypothetical protein ACRD3G_19195 [Vicinamibacterales bacterium]